MEEKEKKGWIPTEDEYITFSGLPIEQKIGVIISECDYERQLFLFEHCFPADIRQNLSPKILSTRLLVKLFRNSPLAVREQIFGNLFARKDLAEWLTSG